MSSAESAAKSQTVKKNSSNYELKSRPKVRVRPAVRKQTETEAPPAKVDNPRVFVEKTGMPTRVVTETYVFGGEANYRIRTDLADEVKPRLYTHTVGLSYGFRYIPGGLTLAAVLTAQYQSAGERRSEVIIDSNDAELFVNDVALSINKGYELSKEAKLSLTLTNEFPTSAEARREQYRSVTTLDGGISYALLPRRLSLGLSGGAYYIWNSYEYSPTTLESNKRNGSYGNISGKLTIWEGLYFSASAGSLISTYTDGTSDLSYRNSVTLGYAWSAVTLSVSMSNGSYLDRGDASLWFVDEYRRILSLGLSHAF